MRLNVELSDIAILLPIYLAIFIFRKSIGVLLHKATTPSLETWNEIESGKPPSSNNLVTLYWIALVIASTLLGFAIADALFSPGQTKYISLDEYRRRWPGT